MQLKMSDLPQRIFDHLTQAISLMDLLAEIDLDAVAASLENPSLYGDKANAERGKAIAKIVRSYKEHK